MAILIEQTESEVLYAGGINTNKTVTLGGSANLDLSGSSGTIKVPTVFPNGLFTTSVITLNTTPVNLFGTTTGFAGTITSLATIALDDANGTVEVYNDGGTLFRIAKGSGGTMKGSIGNTSLTTFASGSTMKAVLVSGTGNVQIIATFKTS